MLKRLAIVLTIAWFFGATAYFAWANQQESNAHSAETFNRCTEMARQPYSADMFQLCAVLSNDMNRSVNLRGVIHAVPEAMLSTIIVAILAFLAVMIAKWVKAGNSPSEAD